VAAAVHALVIMTHPIMGLWATALAGVVVAFYAHLTERGCPPNGVKSMLSHRIDVQSRTGRVPSRAIASPAPATTADPRRRRRNATSGA
jgi:hypothetical protein